MWLHIVVWVLFDVSKNHSTFIFMSSRYIGHWSWRCYGHLKQYYTTFINCRAPVHYWYGKVLWGVFKNYINMRSVFLWDLTSSLRFVKSWRMQTSFMLRHMPEIIEHSIVFILSIFILGYNELYCFLKSDSDSFMPVPDRIYTGPMFIGVSKELKSPWTIYKEARTTGCVPLLCSITDYSAINKTSHR